MDFYGVLPGYPLIIKYQESLISGKNIGEGLFSLQTGF
jgi:hypothetical protein